MDHFYRNAAPEECGLLYRPGEMSIEELNYCKLRKQHPGRIHTTRRYDGDFTGFDWTERKKVELEWPS